MKRAGQGLVEYLLLVSIIVGIVFGIFKGILEERLKNIEDIIQKSSKEVLSQNTMGIPIQWFEGDEDWNKAAQKLKGISIGGGTGAGGAGGPGTGGNRGGPASENPAGGGPPILGAEGSGSSSPKLVNLGSGGFSSGAASKESAEDSSLEKNKKKQVVASSSEEKTKAPSVEGKTEDGKSSKEEKKEEGLLKGKRLKSVEEQEVQQGGCQNLNVFTLLKLLAILGILILLVSLFFSRRKDDN